MAAACPTVCTKNVLSSLRISRNNAAGCPRWKEDSRARMRSHHHTTAALLLRCIGIIALVDLERSQHHGIRRLQRTHISPFGRDHEVFWLLFSEVDETAAKAISTCPFLCPIVVPYSLAASDTGILLRSRSSFRRALSSFSRRNFSSAMLCFLLRPTSAIRGSYAMDEDIISDRGACVGQRGTEPAAMI